MSDRPNNLPLLIALVLAIAVHLLVARPLRGWMIGAPAGDALRLKIDKTHEDEDQQTRDQAARKKPDTAKIGQLDPSTASVMRLVTWDDAQKLLAQQSTVEQPAVQKQVNPDPAAQQTPVDPTPPAQTRPNNTNPIQPAVATPAQAAPQPTAPPQPQQPSITDGAKPQHDKPTESQKPQVEPGRQRPQSMDILALDSDHPALPSYDRASQSQTTEPGLIDKELDKPDPKSDKDERVPKPVPPSPQQITQPQPQQPTEPAQQPSPAAQQQPAAAAQPTPKPNPTAAVQGDLESPPVSEIDSAEIRPGGVFAVQGIRVRTVRPRYSVVAQMTSVPRNPTFRVHFNAQGIVDSVDKLQGSGYDNVDGPIVTALWKWKAEGKLGSDGVTILRLHVLLGVVKDEPGEDSDDE